MGSQLSDTQVTHLRRAADENAGDGAILGITHPTMSALKRRGLVEGHPVPDRLYVLKWRITEAGRAQLEARRRG